MTTTLPLDPQASRILALLVSILPSVVLHDWRTFIGYKEAHDRLRLPRMAVSWGDSLASQGLQTLANWTAENAYPAITGLVIDQTDRRPRKGYFGAFGRSRDDFAWWIDEIRKSKSFDWQPHIVLDRPQVPILTATPLAFDLEIPADRQQVTVYRILRDTALARHVKEIHDYRCQLCGETINLSDGRKYSEAHHIQPLGRPHDGPDLLENVICVCPNHHVELDYGARKLEASAIRSVAGHTISERYIKYHNEKVYNLLK
ncbi:HNH endonuclease [Massilia sp. MP_M2]|uniref:HNH endonuclease n=1 Tax=Massilia sp. MP_M2 TaxID=3071713 RepID=UPI00319E19AC